MLFDLDDFSAGDVLPTDITLRTPIYRRHGIVASVFATFFARLAPRRDARKRRSGNAPPLSDHLRRDIGLTPESPRNPVWDDIRWQ